MAEDVAVLPGRIIIVTVMTVLDRIVPHVQTCYVTWFTISQLCYFPLVQYM